MTTLSPSAPPTEAREREFFVWKTLLFGRKTAVLDAKIGVRNILGNRLHFPHPPIIRKCKKKKQQNYFWALVIGQCSEIMLLLFFALKKKETLFKFSTASKGVKISRHLFWSTGQWSVLQNKCLDIFLPRYPVLHINKVTFFIADALEKCGSNYFGALTIDQCSKIIMYTKFWPCSQRKRNLYVYIYI